MANKQKDIQKAERKRTIITIVSLIVIAVFAGFLFGVRLVAFGAPGAQAEMLMFVWGAVVLVVGLLLAIPYLLGVPLISGDWRVVLVSAVLCIAPMMFLYPRLPKTALQYLAKPVENPIINNSGRLNLIGGIDGIFLGVVIGFLLLFVDPELNFSNRQNIFRFVCLTVIVAGSIVVSFVINEMGDIFDLVANFIPIIVVFLLKLGLKYRDRIRYQKE